MYPTALILQQELLDSGVPATDITPGIPLASLSRWRVGGPADLVVAPSSLPSLRAVLSVLNKGPLPFIVIGDGTNLLFADEGLRGVVLRIGRAFSSIEPVEDTALDVGAGAWVPHVVHYAIGLGLGGTEHAIGIPGTFGGLCVMNGGSRRQGIGDHVEHVDVVDRKGRLTRLAHQDLDFAYRSSRLQSGEFIMVGGRLRLSPAPAAALRREAIAIMASRRAKFPRVHANCGSVFVSDPALYDLIGPPGKAIEVSGLKGMRRGEAQISTDHANFIVNLGTARASDILHLIHVARQTVLDRTGIAMAAEVRYCAPDGTMMPAHEAAERAEKDIAG